MMQKYALKEIKSQSKLRSLIRLKEKIELLNILYQGLAQ